MGVDRWRESWRAGRTAFHRDAVHDDLVAHHDAVLGDARRVLVPLSGRSLDLPWLAGRGHEVVGVEIVEEVVAADFADRGVAVEPGPLGPFRAYRDGRLTVLAGDMLAARPEDLGTFDGAWDRAALVALAPGERPRYAEVVLALMRPAGRILLQTFALDRPPEAGPPYAVSDDEVRRLYAGADVRVIGRRPAGRDALPATTFRIELPGETLSR